MNFIKHEICPLCGSNELIYHGNIEYNEKIINYNRCKRCNLIFMNPMPSQDWYNHFYTSEYWEEKSKKQTHTEVHKNLKQFKKQLNWADKFISFLKEHGSELKEGSIILEVGCAYGLIVQALAAHFHGLALGVEPSYAAREFAINHADVKIIAQNMDQLNEWHPDPPVDMILFSHALENIVNLNRTLSTARALLSHNGLLLIDTVNILYQETTSIFHPYCFCEKSLSILCEKYGFKIIGLQKSGKAKDVFVPRYLTILARKNEIQKKLDWHDLHNDRFFNTKLSIARLWRKIALLKPIKILDRRIHATLFQPSEYNIQTLKRINKEVL